MINTLYDNINSAQPLSIHHRTTVDSYILRTKLYNQSKTHSLTCLDAPMKTVFDLKPTTLSSIEKTNQQKVMAGSVNLISEMQPICNMEDLSYFSSSSNQQLTKQNLKHHFRPSYSFMTPTPKKDYASKDYQNNNHLQNRYNMPSQTKSKLLKSKRSFLHSHHGSVPKFCFRDLPSYPRSTSFIKPLQQSTHSQKSPYTSLPELQSFIEHNCLDTTKTITTQNLPLTTLSSHWKKSRSWLWKSNEFQTNQSYVNNNCRSNLPIIVESPLLQRSSLCSPTNVKTNIHKLDTSFSNENIQQNLRKPYHKTSSLLSHSTSNYEVSSHRLLSQTTARYPSTPVLLHESQKFADHLYNSKLSPMATFDDDSDTISRDSSFLSCLDSTHDYSHNNTSDSVSSSTSSSSGEFSFQDVPSNYNPNPEISFEKVKHSRLSSLRSICNVQ